MDSTKIVVPKAGNIFQQFLNNINSLKQIHRSKEREFEKCNAELQANRIQLKEAHQRIADQEREIETLTNLVLSEKPDYIKHMENVNSLKEQNAQLVVVKDIFASLLCRLGYEVNLQGECGTDIVDKLCNHIQEKRLWDYSRLDLEQSAKSAVQATAYASNKTSVNTVNATTKEQTRVINQIGSSVPTNSIFGNQMTVSSSASQLLTTQKGLQISKKLIKPERKCQSHTKKCRRDKTFNLSDGFRCMCGKTFKWKQNLTRHIRKFTENLQFHCKTCNKSFLKKSVLEKHFKSATCIRANLQQTYFSTGNKCFGTSPTTSPRHCVVNPLEPTASKSSQGPISDSSPVKSALHISSSGMQIYLDCKL